MTTLAQCCIYTIRHSEQLRRIATQDGTGSFFERRAWTTGSALFGQALAADERVAIVFAAAEHWSGLIYWGLLTDVALDYGDPAFGRKPRTDYAFESLRPIDPPRRMSDLTLAKARRPLSEDSIRPYAICLSPAWLRSDQ